MATLPPESITVPHSKIEVPPSKQNVAKPPVNVPVRFTQLFINGHFVDSADGKRLKVINPSTGQHITDVSEGGPKDIDAAVKAARTAYETVWRHTSPATRASLMHKLADLMEEHIDELATLESMDNGKTFAYARNVDVAGCVATIRYYAGWASKIQGKTIIPEGDYMAMTRHEPIGVVGAIIPWNFPLLMACWKLGPCFAAGNVCVLKTSEKTPLSALLFAELSRQAGFPPGVLNVISGYGPTAGEPLARHMDVDKVAFTGSGPVGRKILIAAAESNLKKVTVELGGKSPCIVFPDVDIDVAVEGTHFALFFNHGQCCCAGSRVFVHESIYDEYVKRAIARAKKLSLSHSADVGDSQGPQVDDIQHKKILNYIQIGQKEGATVAYGGKQSGNTGYFIEPTILTNVQDNMTVAKEEIFGPVMAVLKFKTIEEVINRANNTSYGLGASVWTDDLNKAYFVANNIRAGTVWINCHTVLQPSIPFGGYKESGFGRDLGEYALAEYTQVKAIVTKIPGKFSEMKINIHQ
jgi:aldehyde dehydrogenase (NAD+)